jgi:hypothetical protein
MFAVPDNPRSTAQLRARLVHRRVELLIRRERLQGYLRVSAQSLPAESVVPLTPFFQYGEVQEALLYTHRQIADVDEAMARLDGDRSTPPILLRYLRGLSDRVREFARYASRSMRSPLKGAGHRSSSMSD